MYSTTTFSGYIATFSNGTTPSESVVTNANWNSGSAGFITDDCLYSTITFYTDSSLTNIYYQGQTITVFVPPYLYPNSEPNMLSNLTSGQFTFFIVNPR